MGWLIAAAVLTALALLPLGIDGIYSQTGVSVYIQIGFIRFLVFPGKPREKKQPKQKKAPAVKQQPAVKEKKGGSLTDFLPLLKIAWNFLGDLRRKLRLNHLTMHLTMAADDPCDLAINYGKAWAAVGNLLPQLEQLFVIKKKDIQVACDFTTNQTTVYARLKLTITLGRLLVLLAVYGWRAGITFVEINNKRKGGAQV